MNDRWVIVHYDGRVKSFHQLDEDDIVTSAGSIIFIDTKAKCLEEIERSGLIPLDESIE